MGVVGNLVDEGAGLIKMLGKQPGSDPRYRGAAPNRNDFSFLRYTPKKLPERLERSLAALRDPNNPMRQEMLQNIDAGLDVGEDWYNAEELRDWFIAGWGEDEGHRQWSEFLDLVGATSPGSKVPANIGNASAVRQRMYTDASVPGSNMSYMEELQNIENLKDGQRLAKSRTKGYGHKTAGLQELIAGRQVQGAWDGSPEFNMPPARGNWNENPKPKGFTQSLKGSEKNIAADLHFTRYFGMASMDPEWLATGGTEVGAEFAQDLMKRFPKTKKFFKTAKTGNYGFNPKAAVKSGAVPIEEMLNSPVVWAQKPNAAEYGAMEDFMYELGQELGLTGPQTQAALWMGAARKTGVDPTSQTTFMGAIRDRADIQAKKRGQTREQVLFDFIMNKGLLSAPPVLGAGVLGAAMSQGNQAQAATPSEMEIMKYLEANR